MVMGACSRFNLSILRPVEQLELQGKWDYDTDIFLESGTNTIEYDTV